MRPITLLTKISDLLEDYPMLEDTLIELSPAFSKLRSPILRNTIAKVTSVKQAAVIAGIDPGSVVSKLREAAGLPDEKFESLSADTLNTDSGEIPEWYSKERVIIRYDATSTLENGEVPMAEILKYAKSLKESEIFEFSSPFLPSPIIEILNKKGFLVWSEKVMDQPSISPGYLNRVTPKK
jgi:hypothetical protein